MRVLKSAMSWSSTAFIAALVAGCAPGDSLSDPTGTGAMESDLAIGAHGDNVKEIHDYLTRYGYFPNLDLAERYPAWRPIVSQSPAKADVYDERTEEAVRHLQILGGIPTTGRIDQATRALMAGQRCDVPDGIPSRDPSDKFSYWGDGKFPGSSVTWKVMSTDSSVSINDTRAAMSAALNTWAAQSALTFSETTGSANIGIMGVALNTTAIATTTPVGPDHGGMLIRLDTADDFSVAPSTPSSVFDLQSILLHELGHALGLGHSGLPTAVMNPYADPGIQKRVLTQDDNVGISTLYDTTTLMQPAAATDIAAGADGSVWKIGASPQSGGFQIFKYNGAGWDLSDGAAVRIAVAPNGTPWVINSANQIYRRTSTSPFSGGWQLMPGAARDIGIGFDGSVWVIGTNASPDGQIFKFNGSGWDASDGFATRIAVTASGRPWVITSANNIFRHTTSNTTSGVWELLSSANGARDIGAGSGETAWVLFKNGNSIIPAVWNEQPQILYMDGNVAAPAIKGFIATTIFSSSDLTNPCNISVGPNSRPFFNCAKVVAMATK